MCPSNLRPMRKSKITKQDDDNFLSYRSKIATKIRVHLQSNTIIMTTIPPRNNTILSVTILISLCIIIAVTITQHQSNLQENSDVSAQRTIIDTPLMMSSQQQQPQQPRKHTMVGGYSNLGHDDKKLLKSKEVVKVANFALKEYAAKTTAETETAASSSGEQHDSLTVSPEEVESGEVTAVVLEAHRQVSRSLI